MSAAGSLAHWALAIRDNPRAARVNAALAQSVTPLLVARGLEMPAITARLKSVPATQRASAVAALSIIAGNRHLHHSHHHPLGHSLATLDGASQAAALALATGSTQPNAVRLLGNAVSRAGNSGPVNLVELVELLTAWDDLALPVRSRFLVDFHDARRA